MKDRFYDIGKQFIQFYQNDSVNLIHDSRRESQELVGIYGNFILRNLHVNRVRTWMGANLK